MLVQVEKYANAEEAYELHRIPIENGAKKKKRGDYWETSIKGGSSKGVTNP